MGHTSHKRGKEQNVGSCKGCCFERFCEGKGRKGQGSGQASHGNQQPKAHSESWWVCHRGCGADCRSASCSSLELRNVQDVDLEELEALKERENPPLTRFQKGVVAMLIRTEQLESTVRRKKYEIELIIIETGLIPSLTLRLVPQDPTEAGDAEAAAEGKDEETLEDDE